MNRDQILALDNCRFATQRIYIRIAARFADGCYIRDLADLSSKRESLVLACRELVAAGLLEEKRNTFGAQFWRVVGE